MTALLDRFRAYFRAPFNFFGLDQMAKSNAEDYNFWTAPAFVKELMNWERDCCSPLWRCRKVPRRADSYDEIKEFIEFINFLYEDKLKPWWDEYEGNKQGKKMSLEAVTGLKRRQLRCEAGAQQMRRIDPLKVLNRFLTGDDSFVPDPKLPHHHVISRIRRYFLGEFDDTIPPPTESSWGTGSKLWYFSPNLRGVNYPSTTWEVTGTYARVMYDVLQGKIAGARFLIASFSSSPLQLLLKGSLGVHGRLTIEAVNAGIWVVFCLGPGEASRAARAFKATAEKEIDRKNLNRLIFIEIPRDVKVHVPENNICTHCLSLGQFLCPMLRFALLSRPEKESHRLLVARGAGVSSRILNASDAEIVQFSTWVREFIDPLLPLAGRTEAFEAP